MNLKSILTGLSHPTVVCFCLTSFSSAANIKDALPVSPATMSSADGITTDAVVTIWKAQQESVKSFWFEWEEVTLYPVGSQYLPSQERREASENEDDVPLPEQDTWAAVQCRLVFDGKKMRYDRKGLEWEDIPRNFEDREFWSISGVGTYKVYLGYRPESQLNSIGTISEEEGFRDAYDTHVWPIIASLAPTLVGLTPDTPNAAWQLTSSEVVVNSRPCQALRHIQRNYGSLGRSLRDATKTEVYWLDPTRSWRPIRFDRYVGDFLNHQHEVVYDQSGPPLHLHLPRKWKGQAYSQSIKGEVLYQHFTSTVNRADVNCSVPPTLFASDFPPGTRVSDTRTNKRWVVQHVETGEEMRIVTYDETRGALMQLWGCVVAVLVAIGGAWYWRVRHVGR